MEQRAWGAWARAGWRQAAVVVGLLGVAAVGWLLTSERMAGMDDGPGTDPGSLGFYVSAWVVMMAAMMLPSAWPMAAAHAGVGRRRRELGREAGRGATFAFVAGYLVAWTAFGLLAYALFQLVRSFDIEAASWDRDGRYVAAAVVVAAAGYQLAPFKDVCLTRCRSPLAFVVGSWRPGRLGAVRMGVEQGGWCVGCCWALMATLFAVGVMSVAWMAVIAGLVAVEKLAPWRAAAGVGIAVFLAVLTIGVAVAPGRVPGLTIPGDAGMGPGHGAGMSSMRH